MNIELIKKRLIKISSKERFNHALNVAQVAKDLAIKHGEDSYKAEIAGLLHDCAKDLPEDVLREKIKEFQIELDNMMKKIPKLWHPLVGAEIAKQEFKITDVSILRAIRIHSTGAAQMSMLDKIIFLSDKIEPLRDNQGVEEVRAIAENSLDKAILKLLDRGIEYLIKKGLLIHPLTLEARNNMLMRVVFK
ncbi:MAG: bis(5'-nucleosyl)-tetraphosphatase (symmetrical) YqeK [Candidatus Caldatribacteriota bacterium]